MPEKVEIWWPVCVSCGKDIERKTIDWFRQKRKEKGLSDKLPKGCAQCTMDAVQKMVKEIDDA